MKSSTSIMIFAGFAILAIALILVTVIQPKKSSTTIRENDQTLNQRGLSECDVLKVYNYYKVAIDVTTGDNVTFGGEKIVSNLRPRGMITIPHPGNIQYLSINSAEFNRSLNRMVITDPWSIHEVHIGMNSAHQDLSMAGESTKSSLGTSIPRLRIVSHLSTPTILSAGSEKVTVPANGSVMFLGENLQGIHIGTILRDEGPKGALRDFVIDREMSELHIGIVSTEFIPHFAGSKLSFDLDHPDHVVLASQFIPTFSGGNTHPHRYPSGPHNGSFADRSYIA